MESIFYLHKPGLEVATASPPFNNFLEPAGHGLHQALEIDRVLHCSYDAGTLNFSKGVHFFYMVPNKKFSSYHGDFLYASPARNPLASAIGFRGVEQTGGGQE